MILNFLAKIALSGTIAKRVKAAVAEAEAEGAKIVSELRAELAKIAGETKAAFAAAIAAAKTKL